MRYLIPFLVLSSCGSDTEVTREFYQINPGILPTEDASPASDVPATCEETVLRLLKAKRVKVRKHMSLEEICGE
jgi:hypothetical protein